MPRSLALLLCPFRVMRCRLGKSKDDRRGLPQVKFILSVLEPLGLPVAIDVMPEQRAVDPLYGIDVTRMHGSLGHLGSLSVRDSTLGVVETRSFIQVSGDAYLCPLSAVQLPAAVTEGYLVPILTGQQPSTRITRSAASGERARIADGLERLEPLTVGAAVGGALAPIGQTRGSGAPRAAGQGSSRGGCAQ